MSSIEAFPQEEALENHIDISYDNAEAYESMMQSLKVAHAAPVATRSLNMQDALRLNFDEITQFRLPESEYFQQKHPKRQIYIHHTASWGSGAGAINWWKQDHYYKKDANGAPVRDSRGRPVRDPNKPRMVGTFMCISGNRNHSSHTHHDGEMVQAFSSAHWAYHLGVKSANSKQLNQQSVGIELASWGQMQELQDGNFVPVQLYRQDESQIPQRYKSSSDKVVEYDTPHRDFRHYERYTPAQLDSLRKLLLYLCKTYDIPKTYHEDMFAFSQRALDGEPGIWTHVSVRPRNRFGKWDKWDCHPQPELINMLKSLKDLEI